MRTSVQTSSDPDNTDEFPGCSSSSGVSDGELTIVDGEDLVETVYAPGEWYSVTTFAE